MRSSQTTIRVIILAGLLSLACTLPIRATTLTGLHLFSTDASGNSSGGQFWNTAGPDAAFNLYVIQGADLMGSFINSGDGPSTSISVPLAPGTYTFTLYGAAGSNPTGFFGLNLFFNGVAGTPGISVRAPTNTSATMPPFPAFSANSGSMTPALTLTGGGCCVVLVPGAGTLVFADAATTVTLTGYFWSLPSVFLKSRVTAFNNLPDGNDFVGQITLVVTSGGCPHHTVHGHISTVPVTHSGTSAQHHGTHGHTVATGADCPPHAPGHSPGLTPDNAEGFFSSNPPSIGPDFVAAVSAEGKFGSVKRGEYISLFGSARGLFLGEQDEQSAADFTPPANGSPLYFTTSIPEVRIGGVAAKVLYSGLAPGLTGVWQINFAVPEGAPVGNVPVLISYDGDELKSIDVEVQ